MDSAGALGLPRDRLSVVLLSFMRFFSLPPQLLSEFRRELLSSGSPSAPQNPQEGALLEARALGLLSSALKGLKLEGPVLESYARFFLSGAPERPDPRVSHEAGRGAEKDSPREFDEAPDGDKIRAIAEEEGSQDDLLNLMNSFPGREGQHSLVFPLSLVIGGVDLELLLRFFIKESPPSLRLDAFIRSPELQWHCIIEEKAARIEADLSVFPHVSPGALAQLQKKAEKKLNQAAGPAGSFRGFDEVRVQNGEEFPSWAEELLQNPLPFVNEEG